MKENGFCPKCGAVMQTYVCGSCGYISKKWWEFTEDEEDWDEDDWDEEDDWEDGKSTEDSSGTGHVGRYSGSYIGKPLQEHQKRERSCTGKIFFAVLLVLVLLGVGIFGVFITMIKTAGNFAAVAVPYLEDNFFEDYSRQEEYDDYDYDYGYGYPYDYEDDYSYDYGYSYDYYVPSENDAYYEQIVNATVRGLSYDIVWNSTYIYADNKDIYAGYSFVYPSVIGLEAAFAAEINDKIEAHAKSYPAVAVNGSDVGYLDTYVTYMTEDVLSVVFLYCTMTEQEQGYEISALNFNMLTGEELTKEEMLPYFDFIETFRNVCTVQNGDYAIQLLDTMSDEEIRQALYSEDSGVVFYSPVGVEAGFNYPQGWLTATLKYGRY